MKLEHSFTVPTGIDEAWQILLDIERIGPCMPGAAIDSVDGDDFTGTVKVKLGPIGLTYKGKASFVEKDDAAHRAVIDARGRDSRGNGTAAAKVTAVLEAQGGSTLVKVDTDLDITGKPAQFGRGVMVDVGNKLIGQFADNLAATIGEGAGDNSGDGAGEAKPPAAKAAASKVAKAPSAKAPAAKDTTAKDAAAKDAAAKDAAAKDAAAKDAAVKDAAVKDAAVKDAAVKTPARKRAARPKPTPSTAASSGSADESPVIGSDVASEPPTPIEAAATAGPIERAAAEAVAAAPGYSAPAGSDDDDRGAASDAASDVDSDTDGDTGSDADEVAASAIRKSVNGSQPARSTPPRDVEPINLLESAGPAVAKRLAPVVAVLLVLLIVLRRRAKR